MTNKLQSEWVFSSTNFLLAITAIATVIVFYILILFKLKTSNEPNDLSDSSEFPEDSPEKFSLARRMELLEKIKEERIKDYFDKRKRK
jgi:preprotein translocase subunit SecG